MSDLIDRQAAIDAICNSACGSKFCGLPCDDVAALKALPSAQTEIIRCKDCKWFNELGCAIRIIDESDKPKETDFCSFGERKDGDT